VINFYPLNGLFVTFIWWLFRFGWHFQAQQVGQSDPPPVGGFEIQFFFKVRGFA